MSKKLEVVKADPEKRRKYWRPDPDRNQAAGRQRDASSLDAERGSLPSDQRQLAEKIEMLSEYAGGRSKAAEVMGVAVTTLDNYRSGRTQPKFLELLRLAKAANHPIEYLLHGTDFLELIRADPTADSLVALPRYDLQASAGAGALVETDYIVEDFRVGREWLRRNLPAWAPNNAVVGVLEGSGDSMEPTIRDGDVVMVVQHVERPVVERGGVFVFTLDHARLLLKRLQVMANGDLRIISDNKAYEPETIPREEIDDRIIIQGQVFFVGGKPRAL